MKRPKPNILLITSDQQHWNTLGYFNKEIKTPNLDNLAKQEQYLTVLIVRIQLIHQQELLYYR